MKEITNAFPMRDFKIILEFNDGEAYRVFDFTRELGKRIYEPLQDPDVFRLGRYDPELGTVGWPGEIDIAPETLYAESVPLEAAFGNPVKTPQGIMALAWGATGPLALRKAGLVCVTQNEVIGQQWATREVN